MRSIIQTSVVVLVIIFFSAFKQQQSCILYIPAKEGTVLELKTYSDNDKLTSTVKQKVMKVNNSVTGIAIEMKSEMFDKKDKLTNTSEYILACENGVFQLDMRTMVSSEQTEAYKDMKMSVQADKLDIPADPTPGQELKNGTVQITATTEGSPVTMKMTTIVTNRKVEAIEDKTVPAGTFKCVKISYDAEVKNIFTIKMKAVEWYAKDIGLVRSESYNSKGKLQSYTVLHSK